MVTLRDIASSLGLSIQTVSLALRGKGRISDETRQRVQEKAAELRYRRDEAFAALSSYRHGIASKDANSWKAALVHDWESPTQWSESAFVRRLRGQLHTVFAARGLELHEVWLGHRSVDAAETFRNLRSLGFRGIIVGPHSFETEPHPVPVPAETFQAVACGPAHLYPDIPSVEFDDYENFRMAWAMLKSTGHTRIGLVYEARQEGHPGDVWRAAHNVEARLAGVEPRHKVPPLALPDGPREKREALSRWLRTRRPDAIITSFGELSSHLSGIAAPDLPVAVLDPETDRETGVALDFAAFAHALANTLTMVLQRRLTPRKRVKLRLLIPGKRQDSPTPPGDESAGDPSPRKQE